MHGTKASPQNAWTEVEHCLSLCFWPEGYHFYHVMPNIAQHFHSLFIYFYFKDSCKAAWSSFAAILQLGSQENIFVPSFGISWHGRELLPVRWQRWLRGFVFTLHQHPSHGSTCTFWGKKEEKEAWFYGCLTSLLLSQLCQHLPNSSLRNCYPSCPVKLHIPLLPGVYQSEGPSAPGAIVIVLPGPHSSFAS